MHNFCAWGEIIRGTTQLPPSVHPDMRLSFTRNVRHPSEANGNSVFRKAFTPAAPVGNSRRHPNIRKLSADDFLSLHGNEPLLYTIYAFHFPIVLYFSGSFRKSQALAKKYSAPAEIPVTVQTAPPAKSESHLYAILRDMRTPKRILSTCMA